MRAVALAFLLAFAQSAGAADWPRFRGDAAMTGVAAEALPPALKLLWSAEIGESVESSAAIVGDRIYVGTQPGLLVALAADTGAVLWKYEASKLAGVGESSPAVSGDLVFIGDLEGVVHAVDAATGRGRWTFKTGSEIKSSPAIAGERVLIGSYDGHVYALNRDGTLAWKARTEGPVHSTPAVREGVAYVAGCDEMLRGFRITDGREVFATPSGAYTAASPAMHGGRAIYGTFANEVLAVDLASRKIVWRYTHPDRKFPFYSSAAVADGRVFLGGRDKLLHALDAGTGKAVWTLTTRARIDSSPAVSGGRVYVGSSDGRMYAADARSGEKVWEFEIGAPVTASPAIAGGRLVIGAQDGRVYCFGAA
jgi:eukaryotic-like serine/threonine-protein kinase